MIISVRSLFYVITINSTDNLLIISASHSSAIVASYVYIQGGPKVGLPKKKLNIVVRTSIKQADFFINDRGISKVSIYRKMIRKTLTKYYY